MFDHQNWDEKVDQLGQELMRLEGLISRIRARQVEITRELDSYQIDTAAGARTMGEWVASHLDVSHQTASRLMQLANANNPEIDAALASGKWGLDRASLLVKLRQAGATPEMFSEAAEMYSLGRLYGLVDRLRHLSLADEQNLFEYRYLVVQPSLDESAFKLWGHLPGHDGQVVAKALTQRADELPVLPGEGQGQRMADALTTICLDSLTEGSEGRAVTVAEVFVDATLAAESFGETGATVSSGPRVGPNTLSEILCTGKIRVIVTDDHQPISYSHLGEAIPPHIRSFILWRDQGQCSIEGCRSRYRLQPHHIQHRAHQGSHHPDNLITLCWYHHHIAIHQLGFKIDPSSPTPPPKTHRTKNNNRPTPLSRHRHSLPPPAHHHIMEPMRFLVAIALLVLVACTGTTTATTDVPIPKTDPAMFQQLLAELDRPAIVNVWASWCLPCRDEAPLLQAAHEQYGDRIEFIGLDIEDAQPAGRAFISEFGLTFTHYFDFEAAVPAALGGIGVPRTYFFAPGGELVTLHNGVIDEETLASQIDHLLNP